MSNTQLVVERDTNRDYVQQSETVSVWSSHMCSHLSSSAAEVQATRAVMLLSIFLSAVALLVATVGMKCTRFMDGKNESKSTTAMIGGIMFIISGGCSVLYSVEWVSWPEELGLET